MTEFVFTELVNSPHADIVSAALGVSSGTKLTDNDIGKPVKLAAGNNYVLCAQADEIEGFLVSTEANTVNDGFSFGSVRRDKRIIAQVDGAEVGTASVGTTIVAGVSAAIDTVDTYPQIQLGSPADFKWRVIRVISGTGAAGDLVLIEKI